MTAGAIWVHGEVAADGDRQPHLGWLVEHETNELEQRVVFVGLPRAGVADEDTRPEDHGRELRASQQLLRVAEGALRVVTGRVPDLELLLVNNRTYAAEIGHAVSFKTRKAILTRAAQLDVKVTNANARVRKQE